MTENDDVTSKSSEQKPNTTCASGPMRDIRTVREMADVNLEAATKDRVALDELRKFYSSQHVDGDAHLSSFQRLTKVMVKLGDILESVGMTSERKTMKTLWITRDANSKTIYAWGTQPNYRLGEWDKGGVHPIVYPVTESFVKAILGDQWFDDGQFCFRIEIASVTRILGHAEEIVKRLREIVTGGYDITVLSDAIDLIESLSQK